MPSLPNAEQTMTLAGVGLVRAENFSSTPRPPPRSFLLLLLPELLMTMDEKRSGIVLFLVVVVVVVVLRALKREGESVKRERCSSSRDDGSRPILIGRERGSIGASAHKRRFCRTRILFLVFSKGRTLFYSFSSCRPKSGRKKWSTRIFFLSLRTALLTLSFSLTLS